MKFREIQNNNKGFSLVELIVIMAIMAVSVGATGLSLKLLTGQEAKQCANKFSADLEETKTSSMARYGQSITFGYLDADDDEDDAITKSGFYSTKTIHYMTKDANGLPVETPSGASEHRYLGSSSVVVEVGYAVEQSDKSSEDVELSCGETITVPAGYDGTTGVAVTSDSGSEFTVYYDRSTGLYDKVVVNGTEYDKAIPLYMYFHYGSRSFIIKFDHITGKHTVSII